jgi:AcrR family transcriptional regulator
MSRRLESEVSSTSQMLANRPRPPHSATPELLHFRVLSDRFLVSCGMSDSPSSTSLPLRRKRDSRELILQAAEEIVAKRGPAHLTLETAANEAKVSKGGLFYHFRSKEALLEAMIRRSMELLESEHMKYAESLTGERNGKIKANIIGTLRHLEGQRPVLTAVIAAIASDPKLVEPMKESIRKEFQELSKELTLRTEDIAILFLASQGLLLMELLNLSFLTPSQIRKITQRMLELVEDLDPTPSIQSKVVADE